MYSQVSCLVLIAIYSSAIPIRLYVPLGPNFLTILLFVECDLNCRNRFAGTIV